MTCFRAKLPWLLLLVLATGPVSAGPARAGERPRLVLVVVVDQLRRDRLDAELPGGLGRLAREGRSYREGVLDHALTETCAGHATVLTGRHPAHTGIPANQFLDLEAGAVVYCAEDPAPGSQVFGRPEGRSPKYLRVSALGDWLKSAYPSSRVFSVSGKDRAAIMLAGRSPNAAYWFQGSGAPSFTSSRYYMERLPTWVREFNGRDPFEDGFLADLPIRWEHLDAGPSDLRRPDDFPGESKRFARTSGHPLRHDDPDEFAAAFFASPFLDEATLDFAMALVEEERLGRGETPDLLAISLSATDAIGHLYGPYSHESRDALRRLDAALGRLLAQLEQSLGRDQVVVAFTSDHGVLPLPEWLQRTGESHCPVAGGRAGLRRLGFGLLARLHWEFSPLLSIPRPWVLFAGTQIGVDRALARRHGVSVADVITATRRILEAESAIERLWSPQEIASGSDEFARLYRNSFDPERSGDLMVQLASTCLISSDDEGTTHGSPYAYDRAVPILFWGPGIEGGPIDGPARTIDIAPTLARYLGIAAPPDLDGRGLIE